MRKGGGRPLSGLARGFISMQCVTHQEISIDHFRARSETDRNHNDADILKGNNYGIA